jgi:MscS family membrane protein
MKEIFAYQLFGIEVWVYAAALGSIFTGFILQRITNAIILRMTRFTEKTKIDYDEILFKALSGPVGWIFGLAGIYIALQILPIPKEAETVNTIIDAFIKGASMLVAVWLAVRLIDGFGGYMIDKSADTESKIDDQIYPIIVRSLKVFIVIIGMVLVLQNLGYSVSGLLAGFGIGGAALALASKDTVANLFGSVVIFLDRPFQIGDWIDMPMVEGTVEEIGLRTTKVRTFANSLITLPNAAFTTTPINNWSMMHKRRIRMVVGVTYDSSSEKLEKGVELIRQLIIDDPNIHSDAFHVYFDSFGPSSLDIFIYCFTVTTNWGEFLAAKQTFMLKIMQGFEELGLEFAYPTQTLHVASFPEGKSAGDIGKDGIRDRPL